MKDTKKKLSPAQVSVMQHKVTEPPYFGKFWDHFEDGSYACANCGTELFSSSDKIDSHTGWPSFKKPIKDSDLQFKSVGGPDDKIEIRCKKCKSHLGYVISGEMPYYRINSVALDFEEFELPEIEQPEENGDEKKDEKKSESPRVTAASTLPAVTWNIPSIVAGAVVGLVVGASGGLLYCRSMNAVAPMPSATSRIESLTPTTTDKIVPEVQSSSQPRSTPEQSPIRDSASTQNAAPSAATAPQTDGAIASTTQ